jgi:hypothetical protein
MLTFFFCLCRLVVVPPKLHCPKLCLRPFKVGDGGSDLSLYTVGPFRIDTTRLRTSFPFQHASLSRHCNAALVCPVCLSAVTRHAIVLAAVWWHSFMQHLSPRWMLIYERNESVPYQICMPSLWYMLRLTDATCCKLSSRWVCVAVVMWWQEKTSFTVRVVKLQSIVQMVELSHYRSGHALRAAGGWGSQNF